MVIFCKNNLIGNLQISSKPLSITDGKNKQAAHKIFGFCQRRRNFHFTDKNLVGKKQIFGFLVVAPKFSLYRQEPSQ
ncbi:hypothetical protein SLEP1_g27132 [Rubroshorea leprosula]|uniref:Uncharacterized protein n=1 Tax=Rubroshorea leprosula TaxID=152421 RepID=A0AAV5JYR7_9ROSI|nr:hypothetical protein SLEP1_g27132 [Rubroshorea leprosula]